MTSPFPPNSNLSLSAPDHVFVNHSVFIQWTRNETDVLTWGLNLFPPTNDGNVPVVDSHGALSGQTAMKFSVLGTFICSAYSDEGIRIADSNPVIVQTSSISQATTPAGTNEASSTDGNGPTQGPNTSSSNPAKSSKALNKGSETTSSATTGTTSSSSISVTMPAGKTSTSSTGISSTLGGASSLPSSTVTFTSSAAAVTSTTSKSNGKHGVLVGAIVGPVAFIIILLASILFICRRRFIASGRITQLRLSSQEDPLNQGTRPGVTPFTETKGAPTFYPEKSSPSKPASLDSSLPSGSSAVSHWSMTERQARLQRRINDLTAHNAALETAIVAARGEAQNGNVELRTEIELLRQLLQSDWARGLTDEPPPSYNDLLDGAGHDQ